MACSIPVPNGYTCHACGREHRDHGGFKRAVTVGVAALAVIGLIVLAVKTDAVGRYREWRYWKDQGW